MSLSKGELGALRALLLGGREDVRQVRLHLERLRRGRGRPVGLAAAGHEAADLVELVMQPRGSSLCSSHVSFSPGTAVREESSRRMSSTLDILIVSSQKHTPCQEVV